MPKDYDTPYKRELRAFRAANSICVQCKAPDSPYRLCDRCTEKQREYNKTYRDKHRARRLAEAEMAARKVA